MNQSLTLDFAEKILVKTEEVKFKSSLFGGKSVNLWILSYNSRFCRKILVKMEEVKSCLFYGIIERKICIVYFKKSHLDMLFKNIFIVNCRHYFY